MELKICHLYPDILNLYGDQGNIRCMKQRLAWRGIGAEVTEVSIGDTADFKDFDIFFIGGGQDFEQGILLDDLAKGKAEEIKAAVNDGRTFLTICGGYQMLGAYYKTWDGQMCDFIGAIDYYTQGVQERMIGNFMFQTGEESGNTIVVGFENHSGKTFLGEGVKPLGTILSGYGNNGEDKTEGVRYNNVFGSYSHGPILPKNPVFADFILKTALERKYGSYDFPPLDDTLEQNANEYMKDRLSR